MKQSVVSKYTIDGDPRQRGADDIHVERARQAQGPAKWAVRRLGECLNKQGEWEWEPNPSSRDDDFLARCRFDSPEAAFSALGVTPPQAVTFDEWLARDERLNGCRGLSRLEKDQMRVTWNAALNYGALMARDEPQEN